MRMLTICTLALVACQAEVKTENAPPTTAANTPPPATTAPPPATAATTTATTTTAPAPTPTTTAAPPPATTVVFVEPPEPTEPAQQMKLSVADGRPKGLKDGAPEALWIWHEDHAKLWHVRTTTKRALHRFTGAVYGDGGPITELKLTALEFNDKIKAVQKGIGFDFETKGHEDGFDFKVAGNHCVRFQVKVDGKAEPKVVSIGATDAHPPHWHFKLCP